MSASAGPSPAAIPRAIAYPPIGVALDEWWRGHYDHVFVALHPFGPAPEGEDDLDLLKTARSGTWEEMRRATGGHPFRPFALALWCATLVAVRADADAALVERIERTIAANRLAPPWEDTVPPALERPLGDAFARLGADEVTAWDEGRGRSVRLTPADLSAPLAIARKLTFFGPFALHAPGMLATAGTEDISTFIALTERARTAVRPEELFEGFWIEPGTTCDWINPPGYLGPA